MIRDPDHEHAVGRGRKLADRLIDMHACGLTVAAPPGTGRLLLAIGDSWFARWPQGDLLDFMQSKHHYRVESNARGGTRLSTMVEPADPSSGQLAWLLARMHALSDADKGRLHAVLVSCGANDVVGDEATFTSMINTAAAGPPCVDPHRVREVIVALRSRLTTLLATVSSLCENVLGHRVPILIHGYDHPVADGRGTFGKGWLRRPLEALGYADPAARAAIMKQLIDAFNEMQEDVAAQMPDVIHVDLRGTLKPSGDGDADDYKDYWQTELHPAIPKGFGRIADKVAQHL